MIYSLINISLKIKIILLLSLLASGCSLHLIGFSQDDESIINIYKGDCNQQITFYKNTLQSLIKNSADQDDNKFLYDFDKAYFNISNFLLREKSLSTLHPSRNIKYNYIDCSYQARKLLTKQLSSPALYQRMLSVDAKHNDEIYLYKSKILEKFISYGAHLPNEQRDQIKILKKNESILKKRFLLSLQEDMRSVAFRVLQKSDDLPSYFIKRVYQPERNIYEITTNPHDYFIFMSNSKNEFLRKTLYNKKYNRGYPENEHILKEILKIREKIARILGFDNYADYSLSKQSALTTDAILSFLKSIESALAPKLKSEINDLEKHQLSLGISKTGLNEWNYLYLKAHMSKKRNVDTEILKGYFLTNGVIDRLIKVMEDFYELSFKETEIKAWHPSVKSFKVYQNKKLMAIVHLDITNKNGNYQLEGVMPLNQGLKNESIPEAVIVANLKQDNAANAYLDINGVEALFHHFGHLIHIIFSGTQSYGLFSGLNIESDFIEVPSFLNEAMLWNWPVFKKIAVNSRNEPIPFSWYKEIKDHRQLYKAIDIQRQICLAHLALELHRSDSKYLNLYQIEQRIFQRHSPFNENPERRVYANFKPFIQYGANFYAYLWSQAVAADFIKYFRENGFQNKKLIRSYIKKILRQGGKKPAYQLIEDFLKRPFNTNAYIESFSIFSEKDRF